jgi:hypothetical protein
MASHIRVSRRIVDALEDVPDDLALEVLTKFVRLRQESMRRRQCVERMLDAACTEADWEFLADADWTDVADTLDAVLADERSAPKATAAELAARVPRDVEWFPRDVDLWTCGGDLGITIGGSELESCEDWNDWARHQMPRKRGRVDPA